MLKGIYGILIGMLLVLVIMFGSLFINSGNKSEKEITVKDPKYHLQIIVQSKDDNFWSMFKEGAKVAEEELGVFIEFVPLEQLNTEQLMKAVEMGVNSGVDGIALQAADVDLTQQMIDEAKAQGVELITYENNYAIAETPIVGTNNYSLGTYAGKMAIQATGGKGDAVVIYNSAGNEEDKEFNNLIMQGIDNAFGSYGSINRTETYPINSDMFEAEKVFSEIMESGAIPDLIICMDEKCTPGIAQLLVDYNMVGDVKLVGYGFTALTLEYIEHGVIYGTICPDAYEIGYQTVTSLIQLLEGNQISDAISTGLNAIDKSNVTQYTKDATDNE